MKKWLNDLYAILLKNGLHSLDVSTNLSKSSGAGFHSSIYRGKYLGDTYTDEQKQAIASGTFDDLFVGDYWTINGVVWRIADFDYYYNVGNTPFTKHHVVIVPDTVLYEAQMNSTNTTEGAYIGSEMHTSNLDEARAAFNNAFGSSFIPTHKCLYANAVSGGMPSGYGWVDVGIELMNESQLYGSPIWVTNGYNKGTQSRQFKLFVFDPTKIYISASYWLTDIRSSGNFSVSFDSGAPGGYNSSESYGVRPFACLVGDNE